MLFYSFLLLQAVEFGHDIYFSGLVQCFRLACAAIISSVLLSTLIVFRILPFVYWVCSCFLFAPSLFVLLILFSPSFRLFSISLVSLILSSRTAGVHLRHLHPLSRATVDRSPSWSIYTDMVTFWMFTRLR